MKVVCAFCSVATVFSPTSSNKTLNASLSCAFAGCWLRVWCLMQKRAKLGTWAAFLNSGKMRTRPTSAPTAIMASTRRCWRSELCTHEKTHTQRHTRSDQNCSSLLHSCDLLRQVCKTQMFSSAYSSPERFQCNTQMKLRILMKTRKLTCQQ